MKTPIRLICKKVSEAEWFYKNYKHVFEKEEDADKLLKQAKKHINSYQIIIGDDECGWKTNLGLITGCEAICENGCKLCNFTPTIPVVSLSSLIREEKLKRILK